MTFFKGFNLTLRALMELGIVLAFGYWGYWFGSSFSIKIILCLVAPLIGFGFWGLVDFHQFGKLSEFLRLIQELLISGLAAVALYTTGQGIAAWILAGISIVYHILVYLDGDTLLNNPQSQT